MLTTLPTGDTFIWKMLLPLERRRGSEQPSPLVYGITISASESDGVSLNMCTLPQGAAASILRGCCDTPAIRGGNVDADFSHTNLAVYSAVAVDSSLRVDSELRGEVASLLAVSAHSVL